MSHRQSQCSIWRHSEMLKQRYSDVNAGDNTVVIVTSCVKDAGYHGKSNDVERKDTQK